MSVIDLRSDTVTRPTDAMRMAIAAAEVGDDMFGEDPTVNRLEARVAELFSMEAAVYNCSGTQSNQMAVRAHCQLGEELLIEETSHIANYEAGGPAALSGVTCRTLRGSNGLLDVEQLEGRVRPNDQHYPATRLICLENSTNQGGGRCYSLEQIQRISVWARQNGLPVHVDGARLFNACAAQGYSPREFAQYVDSISICFSKGLGCPMGSILIGKAPVMARARRARKMFGGALRQAGMMATAALYALDHHVERLADDHAHARLFAERVAEIPGLSVNLAEIETNLVFFNVAEHLGTAAQLSGQLAAAGVRINSSGGPQRLRAVTHLDVTREDVLQAVEILAATVKAGFRTATPVVASGPYTR